MAKPGVNISGEVVLKNGTANVTFVSTSFTPSELSPIGESQVQRSANVLHESQRLAQS